MPVAPSLIVTIALDRASHLYFTELRTKYYPAHCNYMEAHLSFFHKLPVGTPLIDETLKTAANRKTMNIEVAGIKLMNNGNAFTVTSNELKQLHKAMQKTFDTYLTTKDRKKLWPHITVQNKVTAFKAKQTNGLLLQDFKPFTIRAIGFSTWLFTRNTWQHEQDYLFASET